MTNNTPRQPAAIVVPLADNPKSGGQEIRLKEVVHILLKRKVWIIICAMIGLVFGLCLSVMSYVKAQTVRQYSIRTSIALASQSENGLFSKSSRDPDSADFHLAEDMVDATQYILTSDSILNEVIEEINLLGVSARDIYNSIHMDQYKKTQIILINLYWSNASEGVQILEALNRLAPEYLIDSMKLGSVTVINQPTAHFVIGGNLNLAPNLLLGLVLGVIMGMALSVLDLLLHPTLLTLSDVERRLKIPLLGAVGENYADEQVQMDLLDKNENPLIRSELGDMYLGVAHALKRRLGKQPHACLIITSSERSEGRTSVTAGLAAALARIGVRVLAVDCDFSNPMLTGYFVSDLDSSQTINALYQGRTPLRDAVLPVNNYLHLLPAQLEKDPLPMNQGVVDLIRKLREDYEIVLLDTPPVGSIADTLALNDVTEQALFVIQYDGVTQAGVMEAITRLKSAEIQCLGAVVNRWNRKRGDFRSRQELEKKQRPLAKLLSRFKRKPKDPNKGKKGKAPKQAAPKGKPKAETKPKTRLRDRFRRKPKKPKE